MITDDKLIEQYQKLHKGAKYGQTARSALGGIRLCIDAIKPGSIIEYGCGQSRLHEFLAAPGIQYDRYDPAIEGLTEIKGERYDLLINTDVLEHIPEKDLDAVLSHFKSLSDHAYIRISTRLARTILPNGENAHCTVWPGKKWLDFIRGYYPDAEMAFDREGDSCLILTWKSGLCARLAEMDRKWESRKKGPIRKFLKGLERAGKKVRDAIKGRPAKKQG